MEVQENNKDKLYMDIAERISMASKDPITKVGAVIVNNGRMLSIGYNGAPRDFPDDLVPLNTDDSELLINQKNTFMVHAELNSILNYGGTLKDLQGATVYTTVSPCIECVKALIQCGIKNIVYKEEYHRHSIWDASKYILDLAHVSYRKLNY